MLYCYGLVATCLEVAYLYWLQLLTLMCKIWWVLLLDISVCGIHKGIGGGSYLAGRAAAAHFLALVGRQCVWPAHFWALNQT